MSTPPLIGLPGRRKTGAQVAGVHEEWGDIELDLYYADFARGVLEAGGLPLHLSLDVPPAALAPHLDGVLLPGGADIDPGLYGAEPSSELFPPEPIRDRFELSLLEAMNDHDRPVLGVCRGLQLMNVHAGGTLDQHVPEHSRFDLPRETELHEVRFEPRSEMGRLYGPSLQVNSLHHQRIDRLADGYRVTGTAPDGTIEAIEAHDRPWIAVQWHPELMIGRADDPVFAWLVEAARP